MLKRIALIAGGLIVVLAVVIATRPGHFHVERTLPMPVASTVVYSLLNDFRAWPSWSPWEKLDPEMKREVSGAPHGVGAKYAWIGNDQVGSGNMEIVESKPEQIKIRLEFKEPFAATNITTFAFAPAPATAGAPGTRVTWAMDGENNFAAKAMGLFMDMDAMIGKDFEAGLANLGALAEGAAELKGAAAPAPVVVPAGASTPATGAAGAGSGGATAP
jgi:Polyketide cyclase / dehydrase and lipid transport